MSAIGGRRAGDGDTDPSAPALPEHTTLVLVRHAQTTWGATGRYVGRQDVPLSELGIAQLAPLARRLADWEPALVLTSPLSRCRRTAQAIAAEVGLSAQVDDGLVDGRLGEWAGHRPTEIARDWPAEFADWRADPDAAPPGGESFTDIRRRMTTTVERIVTEHRGRTVVLVSHAAPTKMVCAWAMQAPSEVAYRMRIDNASVSVVEVAPDDRTVLVTANDTGHLVTLDPVG